MKNSKILLAIVASLYTGNLPAQDLFTLEKAVTMAMEHNLDIKIERNNTEIAENNANKGNAGLLPTLDLTGSYDYNYLISQTQETGDFFNFGLGADSTASDPVLGGDGLTTSTYGASITASYILFNGFQGRYRYQQLKTNQAMAQKQLETVIENIFEQTLNAYLEIARKQAQLKINLESILISAERLARSQNANEYGNANTLQVLQAEVDLKNDSVEYRNTILAYTQQKKQLILLLDLPLDMDFTVEENIRLTGNLDYGLLRENMIRKNATLQTSRYGLEASEQAKAIENATRFPTLSLTGGFNYNRQEAEQSLTELTQSYGPVVGLRLNYAVFDGNQRKVRQQNAAIDLENQKTTLHKNTLELEIQLLNTFQNYENYKLQLSFEQSGLPTYERNFEKTQEDYNLGAASATDLRSAQLNLVDAKNRLLNLEYNIKTAETTLLRLAGDLITTSNQ